MKILTVSDKESTNIYHNNIKQHFYNIDLAISCGDLSYYYLEYIISALDIPLYFVRGNHAKKIEYGSAGPRTAPWGGFDLHRKVIRDQKTGLILCGIEGSLRYNYGDHQYTQQQMWALVLQLVPALMINKARFGRYFDILVTHAPPWGIHDQEDTAHQGVKAFRWLIETFKPSCHVHGHIHIYHPKVIYQTLLGNTLIVNTYGYRKIIIDDLHSNLPRLE